MQFPSVDIDIKFWITIMITTWFWQVHLTFQNENCLVRILSRSLLTDWPYGKCPRLCLCLWTESRKVLQLRRLLTVRITSINGTSAHSYFLSTLTSFSMKQSSFGILISHPCGAYMLAAPWPGTAWNRMNFCFNAHTLTGENGWVSPERQLMFLHQSGQPSSADTWLPMTHEWSCSRQIPKSKIVLAHGLYYWYTVYLCPWCTRNLGSSPVTGGLTVDSWHSSRQWTCSDSLRKCSSSAWLNFRLTN